MPAIATNKKAFFDYEILEQHEAGLALLGLEVKAIKTGHINLQGSHITIKGGELYLLNANIHPYQPQNTPVDYDPSRSRKLLLHKSEIRSLLGRLSQRGLTLIPLSVYIKGRRIKMEFGLARGKKKFDKRETIKKREVKKKIERAMRGDI